MTQAKNTIYLRYDGEADMLARVRTFHTDSLPYDQNFQYYGLNKNFRSVLTSCTPPARGGVAAFRRRGGGSAFEASFSNTATATAEHVAATADTSSKLRQGMVMVIVRILDGIVRNRYANDPGKLAAWISAGHVEKAPKKKAPTP